MTSDLPGNQAELTERTRAAYDRLAGVWSSTTDDGPFNGLLERPALQALVPAACAGPPCWTPAAGPGRRRSGCWTRALMSPRWTSAPGWCRKRERRCAGRGRFAVADLSQPLPLEPGSLDGITCSLVLHYVQDWSVPLRSFAAALRPGGWAVLSLDHPFGRLTPGRRGGYFDTELVSDTWRKADVEVTQHFWRRPLAAALGAFADAGFVVDRVTEPQPSAQALRQFPAELGPWPACPCSSFTDCGSGPDRPGRRGRRCRPLRSCAAATR